ncbi:MAG TPA: ABC transporter permease subunit [Candidatus Nanoarchaeia archaeon]|nr:ABC transporter permease subunit [Candidatus Nanoarchaeia archaeon]
MITLSEGNLLIDFLITAIRVFAAFIAACTLGIPVGLLMGYFKKVYDSLEFVVEFFRAIPPTALFPLFLLFFGIGDLAKISIAFWGGFLIVIINSMYGIKNANKLRIKAAVIMKASKVSLFTKVILPEAMPQIMAGMRTALSLTLILIVVVEMFIGTSVGLGHRIINAQLVYETSEMYSAIIMAGLLGFFLNKMFMILERRFVHWSGK